MFIQTGEIPANSTVGRMLMNLVDSVPQIESQEFEAMMNNNMQVGDCSSICIRQYSVFEIS